MKAHATAVIEAGAEIAHDVEIGPYAVIGGGAKIGAGCRIHGHAQIVNAVELGENCEVGHGCVIGANPQDTSFADATSSGVAIGDGTILREHVTVHRSSAEGGVTRLGKGNYLMVGSHVGHDAEIGDRNILANHCLLGGHVKVGNAVFVGGGAAFHQFVRVGDLCMVKGLTAISQDVPPFVIMSGSNQVRGLNSVGMRRAGIGREARESIKTAFGIMMQRGLSAAAALEAADGTDLLDEAKMFVDFFRSPSRKGICHLSGRRLRMDHGG